MLQDISNEPSPPPAASDPIVTSIGEYVTWGTDISLGGRLSRKLSYSFHYGFRFDSKDEADDGSLIRGGLTLTF